MMNRYSLVHICNNDLNTTPTSDESYTVFTFTTTVNEDGSGNVTVEDVSDPSDDSLTFTVAGGKLRIADSSNVLGALGEAMSVDDNTVDTDAASTSIGSVTIIGAGGTDSATWQAAVDLSGDLNAALESFTLDSALGFSGKLSVDGDLTLDDDSDLRITARGGGFDQVEVTGSGRTVTLGGDLTLIDDGYEVSPNEVITLIDLPAGATLAAGLQVAAGAPDGSVMLVMLPDTGERYLSSPLFADITEESDDAWLASL